MPRPQKTFPPLPLLATLFCLIALLGTVFGIGRFPLDPKRVHSFMALALFVGCLLRFSFATLQPWHWQPVSAFWALLIASPVTTSFFTEARQLEREGAAKYLRHYHEGLREKPFHAATHPPGLTLQFAALRLLARLPFFQAIAAFFLDEPTLKALQEVYQQVMRGFIPDRWRDWRQVMSWELRAAWWGAIVSIIASLLSLVLWAWVITKGEGVTPLQIGSALALIATVPSALWWVPTIDSWHLLVLLFVLVCALQWRQTKSSLWAVLTGLVMGKAVWMAFKNGIPCACILLWRLWESLQGRDKQTLVQCLIVASLMVVPFGFAQLLFGFQPFQTLKAAGAAHAVQAGHHARTYLFWLLLNPLDFVMGLGGAWLGLVLTFLRRWWRERRGQPSLVIVTIVTLFVLNASGFVRGEVARLWLPFMPLLTTELGPEIPKDLRGALFLCALQGSVALALHLHLRFLAPW